MKFYRLLMASFIAVFLISGISQAVQFEYEGGNNDESVGFAIEKNGIVPTIGGRPLEANDEIGVFALRDGVWSECFGGLVYPGQGHTNDLDLTAYGLQEGDTIYNPEDPTDFFVINNFPGFKDGETIYFHVYDASEDKVYEDVDFNGTALLGLWNGTWKDNYFSVKTTKLNAVAPPRAPGSLSPSDGTVGISKSANMNWEDIIDDGWATTYELQVSTNGTDADIADVTGLTNNTYSYSLPNDGTTYHWRVRGNLTGEGAGDWSDWQEVMTKLGDVTLISPANMAAGVPLEVMLEWDAVTGATDYEYEIYSDAGLTTLVGSGTTSSTSVTNTANAWGLANGTDYWWRIKATAGANESDWSAAWKFTTQLGAVVLTSPADGTAPVAFNMPGYTVSASWQALTGAATYEVQIATNMSFSENRQTFSGVTGTTYDFAGLESWTQYYWRVRGVDAMDNDGEWSSTWTFTTDLLPPMNPDPADNAVAVVLDGNLMWGAVNGATSYDVVLATDMALNNTLPGFPKNVATPSASYTGLDFETDYYWQVTAKNATSTATSEVWKLTSKLDTPNPDMPNDGSVCNETSLTLSWEDFGISPPNDHYNLQISTDMNFGPGTFVSGFDGTGEIDGISQLVTGLNYKTTYYWRVQAFKNNQLTGWSNVFSFETENDIVNLLSPDNGIKGVEKTNINATWDAQADASAYTFEYADNPTFTSSTTVVVNNPTATIAGPLMNGQMYYWRVYSDACGADMPADAEVRNFTVQLAAPNLVSPVNGATEQDLSGTLTWDAVTGASGYRVWMSTTPDFSSDVHINTTVATNSYNFSGIANSATHYWKVAALDGSALGEESAVYSMETIDLGPPEQTFPVDGFAGALFTIDLNWNEYIGAESYNVQVSTDPTFTDDSQLIVETNTGLNQFVQLSGLTYNQTVYWRTQTVLPTEEVSNWAAPFSFTTIPEPVINGDDDICDNTSGVYTVTVDPNIGYSIDYQWSVSNATINGADDATALDASFDSPGTAQLTVTRSSANWGTWTDSYTLDVTVNPIIDLGNTYEIMSYYEDKLCVNETLTFRAIDNMAPETYEWYVIDGETETMISSTPVFDYSFAAPGTYTVELRTFDPAVCGESSYSMDVVIDETCPIMLTVDDLSGCKYGPATFSTDVWGGDGNYSFNWHPGNYLDDSSIEEPTVLNVLWNQNFTINVSDGNGLTAIDYAMLNSINPPNVTLDIFEIYPQATLNIDLTSLITYISDANATQYWYYTEGGSTSNSDDDFDYTNAPLKQPFGMRRFYMQATNSDGCTSLPKWTNTFRLFSKDVNEEDVVASMSGSSILSAYPNPVVNNVNVYAEFNETSNIVLKVADLIGNETVIDNAYGVNTYQNTVDMSQFTAGAYFIIIDTGKESVIKRVIKQ